MSKKIILLYNTSAYVFRFRLNLIKALKANGYEVCVVSPTDSTTHQFEALGIEHVHVAMSQYGMNPLKELVMTFRIWKIYRAQRPLAALHFTIKPNVFGTIAARFSSVPVINNVAGAGRLFSSSNRLVIQLVRALFRFAFKHSHKVFFQNDEDEREFLRHKLVSAEKSQRIPGSGVDLDAFQETELPKGNVVFLFVGRLLLEKGVAEFIEAARMVTRSRPGTQFQMVGECDADSSYVSQATLGEFINLPGADYHGVVAPDKIAGHISRATCVVLPSYYREGVPRSLLEACASGRPIITTDNVGCRDVVVHKENGFEIPPRDMLALARAMENFVDLSQNVRSNMGHIARKIVERKFDEKLVVSAYLGAISDLI